MYILKGGLHTHEEGFPQNRRYCVRGGTGGLGSHVRTHKKTICTLNSFSHCRLAENAGCRFHVTGCRLQITLQITGDTVAQLNIAPMYSISNLLMFSP